MDTKYRCRCRALENQGDEVRLSLRWLSAPWDELRLTPAALEWRTWSIPYEEIEDAMIYEYPLFMLKARTLVIWARGANYHFQLPSISQVWYVIDPVWLGAMPFPLRFESESARSFRRNNRAVLCQGMTFSALVAFLLFALVGLMLYG
jgi:hypothetical protein